VSIFASYRERADEASAELARWRACREAEKKALDEANRELENVRSANELARGIAAEVQARVCGCVAGVVSRCLEAVFDEPYEFKMDFVERRGRTEVDLTFVRDGAVVDPITASGGGVVDVASFALRLAALLLLGSKTRKVLVLDEPFRFLSEEYREKIRKLLNELASEMKIQILMVTHIRELETGKVVRLG